MLVDVCARHAGVLRMVAHPTMPSRMRKISRANIPADSSLHTHTHRENFISTERASQEEQNGANFSSIAPSSEEL